MYLAVGAILPSIPQRLQCLVIKQLQLMLKCREQIVSHRLELPQLVQADRARVHRPHFLGHPVDQRVKHDPSHFAVGGIWNDRVRLGIREVPRVLVRQSLTAHIWRWDKVGREEPRAAEQGEAVFERGLDVARRNRLAVRLSIHIGGFEPDIFHTVGLDPLQHVIDFVVMSVYTLRMFIVP